MFLLRYILILLLPVLAYMGLRKLAIRYSLNQRQFNMLLVLAAILVTVVVLILLGRLPVHFIVAPIMVALTFMLRNLPLLIRLLPIVQMFRSRTAKSAYGAAGAADTSSIRTRFLLMQLQLSSGDMDGDVLEGKFKGAKLSTLSMDALLELAVECARDADSLQILEAYLDRVHPQWRAGAGDSASQASPRDGAGGSEAVMTEAMALEILGLQREASRDDVVQAHRRLMQKMHPDRGGSDYLAKKINAARDFLLDRL
ncbi:MAG: molecular chaperone DnaJ [Gammaproteobacteria bacterium]|nr:molecular chaperone DnaJ [Gammaproteobacteria bacterium]MDP2141958.1 molecular chaperone DnaJ [Gammaproteobacteria bacterium]MDP2347160.1 molecular chaperone DnaJ [Gammaproteobacteria bacterium]